MWGSVFVLKPVAVVIDFAGAYSHLTGLPAWDPVAVVWHLNGLERQWLWSSSLLVPAGASLGPQPGNPVPVSIVLAGPSARVHRLGWTWWPRSSTLMVLAGTWLGLWPGTPVAVVSDFAGSCWLLARVPAWDPTACSRGRLWSAPRPPPEIFAGMAWDSPKRPVRQRGRKRKSSTRSHKRDTG